MNATKPTTSMAAAFDEARQKTFPHGKVALFIGEDATARGILSLLVPRLIQSGIEPVIFLPKHAAPKPNKVDLANQFPLKELAFWERVILQETVEPFLDSQTDMPNTGILYTPNWLSRKHNLQAPQTVANVNDPEFIRSVQEQNFIGGVSIRCYQIFEKPAIDALKKDGKGFLVNLHPGRLSQKHAEYEQRGILGPLRVMLQGYNDNFWTLHHIEEGIDTGAYISREGSHIEYGSPLIEVYTSHMQGGANQVGTFLYNYTRKQPIPTIKAEHKPRGPLYTFPTQDELRRFFTNNDGHGRIENPQLVDPEEMIRRFYLPEYTNDRTLIEQTLRAGLAAKIGERAHTFYQEHKASMVDWYQRAGLEIPEWHRKNVLRSGNGHGPNGNGHSHQSHHAPHTQTTLSFTPPHQGGGFSVAASLG